LNVPSSLLLRADEVIETARRGDRCISGMADGFARQS
jgi:hypothetical protein